jgi:septum formation protein
MSEATAVILASGSAARRAMLQAAGVVFDVMPATIDEEHLRQALLADNADIGPVEIAAELAAAKAAAVSQQQPDALVIGSDQVLDIEGDLLTKPGDAAGVRASLERLSGRTHALHSAVALAQNGIVLWSSSDTARLTMRPLTAAAIERYVDAAGDGVHQCVGAYQIEGLGIQLFDRIEGDHFTILGMPLLPLLAQLRTRGAIAA